MWLEPLQVAGAHNGIYEAYYQQVDPNGTGAIQALDAARFLKKSRLSDVVLSKIWDLSDPTGKGYLDKAGLFVSLKLVALAQAGRDISMNNIHADAPPPKIGEVPAPVLPRGGAAAAAPAIDWSMKPAERDKYNQLFDSLQPSNGLIAGNKVKGVLMESKLPLKTLGQIWDLADQDKDGMLDRHEFCVAMHLVYKALEKYAVPTTLPPALRRAAPARPPSRPPSRPASPARPPRPAPPPAHNSNASLLDGLLDLSSPPRESPAPAAVDHFLTPAEKVSYYAMFTAADADRDGYVSGLEIKDTFLKSGLPQRILADIWALSDSGGVGKLDRGQFCAAMWMLQRAAAGHPPAPPPPPPPPPANDFIQPSPADPLPALGPQPTAELEAIAREVEALARERRALDADVRAREHELAGRGGEAESLQRELDTLTATLKQLENQKGEAQKRLNDLKTQTEKLRSQVVVQEAAAADTEKEVSSRRSALATQQQQQQQLARALQDAQQEEEALTSKCRRAVLAVSQAKIKISHLEEHLSSLQESLAALSAGSSGAAHLTHRPLYSKEVLDGLVAGNTPTPEESKPIKNEFGAMNGARSDPFTDNSHDPFAPTHNNKSSSGFSHDPFASDPFAGDSFTAAAPPASSNDPSWEADPFAVLHAPPPGSTPALPPKPHKTPPPRPAPPRPAPPGKRPTTAMDFTEDPFKDYRYEDPFNIEDPFADVADKKKKDPFGARPTSVAGFETDDLFSPAGNLNGSLAPPKPSGRVSAPPVAYDPFTSTNNNKATPNSSSNDVWAAWPNDSWAEDSWDKPATQKTDAWPNTKNTKPASTNPPDAWGSNNSSDWQTDSLASKTDSWANKTDNWAADWGADQNRNLNETWPSNTLPSKKEKSPRPVQYAKSLVHTIGGIGRHKQGKKSKPAGASELPTEEQQWAWAASESRRAAAEAEKRRRQEDAELQLALAISRQEK